MRDWRTDAEKSADERNQPKLFAEGWFIGTLSLVASVSAILWALR